MIGGQKVLALIPARGGSKGVPGKNLRELGGKPLIAWTIEAARRSAYIDRLVLSSDEAGIIEVARRWGCEVPFRRPAELAADDTPGIRPVLHALEQLPGYDFLVLLQPTSPLRSSADIDRCLELSLERGGANCVSVTEPDQSPYWMYALDHTGRISPLWADREQVALRQQLPAVYALNGAVYVARCQTLLAERSFLGAGTVGYPMPKERSIDIDTELDLAIAELLIQGGERAPVS